MLKAIKKFCIHENLFKYWFTLSHFALDDPVWGVSLAIGWQPFQALQLLGFAVLITGMCVYNDVVIAPIGRKLAEMCRTRSE